MKIEGRNAVLEALKSENTTIDVVMVEKGTNHEIVALTRKRGIKLQFVDKYILDKNSLSGRHQGFMAITSEFNYCEVEDILQYAQQKEQPAFLVVLDGVMDPHNLGSILRVCECAGVHGVIIPKNRSASVNETVLRVSSGAAEHVKVARVVNLNQTIELLKKNNIWVYGADMDGESMYDVDLTGNIALVIGGEGLGISRLTKELCDGVVAIPLLGQVNSLNASVACGVAVYECVRQRKVKK